MDSERFDALSRSLSSRRSALGGLLGGAAALLGLAGTEEAGAQNPPPACQRVADPAKRRRCLRRAHARNRRQRCTPTPPAALYGGRCSGTVVNNCGKQVDCPACPAGRSCLTNNSCGRSCRVLGTPGDCPAGCRCGILAAEGGIQCIPISIAGCADVPQACASTTQCPQGFFCGPTTCGTGGAAEGRCLPICPG
jgi:hypothetical protein